jgi:hypothetical protein
MLNKTKLNKEETQVTLKVYHLNKDANNACQFLVSIIQFATTENKFYRIRNCSCSTFITMNEHIHVSRHHNDIEYCNMNM